MRAVEQDNPEAVHWHVTEKDQRTICGYSAMGCMWENAPGLITCLECLRKLGLSFEITGDMLTNEMEVWWANHEPSGWFPWAACEIDVVYMARFKPEDPVRRKLVGLIKPYVAHALEDVCQSEAEDAANQLLECFNITEK